MLNEPNGQSEHACDNVNISRDMSSNGLTLSTSGYSRPERQRYPAHRDLTRRYLSNLMPHLIL